MKNLGKIIKKDLQIDVFNLQGAGAAGGAGAGAVAFLGGKLESGFSLIAKILKLKDKFKGADIIFTGEGKLDQQTLFGKVPWGVKKIADEVGVEVIAIGGTIEERSWQELSKSFRAVFAIVPGPISLDTAMEKASFYLELIAQNILQVILEVGKKI